MNKLTVKITEYLRVNGGTSPPKDIFNHFRAEFTQKGVRRALWSLLNSKEIFYSGKGQVVLWCPV